jgi:large subunit ribosomal protein L9
MIITIKAKAGDEGKLFGSIGTADIAAAVVASGVEVERSEVRLPAGAFRQLGEYRVQIHLHSDVNTELTLFIEAE